jgi:hypothetical protein
MLIDAAAIPAASRPRPNDRARNAIATGTAANETTPMTISPPEFETTPRLMPRTAATAHVRPGPLNRNSWYPR